jgi:hypothetical protein
MYVTGLSLSKLSIAELDDSDGGNVIILFNVKVIQNSSLAKHENI